MKKIIITIGIVSIIFATRLITVNALSNVNTSSTNCKNYIDENNNDVCDKQESQTIVNCPNCNNNIDETSNNCISHNHSNNIGHHGRYHYNN